VLSLDFFQEAANKIEWVWNLLRVPVVLALPIWWITASQKQSRKKRKGSQGLGHQRWLKMKEERMISPGQDPGDRAESGESPE